MLWILSQIYFGFIINGILCETGKCGSKLLNDNDKVPDSAFSATSHFIHSDENKKKTDFSAKAARESYDKEDQEFAWCPLNQVDTSLSEYLEIDLGRLTMVKVVQTKGRFAQGAGKEFTPFYRIRYSRDSSQTWIDYKKFKDKGFQEILNGPNDAFLDAFETLDPPIVTRLIRIFPYSFKSRRICLKLQLFGCDFTNNLLEYQMIQGTAAIIINNKLEALPVKSSVALNPCFDNGYDGNYYGGRLQDGLGLLTNNATGEALTNKTMELYDFVGWKKESIRTIQDNIRIKFIFINSRNFSSVRVYSYSNHALQVDYFYKVKVTFSDDGGLKSGQLIISDLLSQFSYHEHFIDINLRSYFGRYVEMTFYFHSQWFLLSEIIFTSDLSNSDENDAETPRDKYEKDSTKNISMFTAIIKNEHVHQQFITTTFPTYVDKSVSLEIIYLLSILLCLLLGVITAICSFWIVIRRKKSQRRKIIKKQALALCSQNSYIPYTHHSNSLQCLTSSLPQVGLQPRGNYPSFTVDRLNYPNGTIRTIPNTSRGYHSHNNILDQNGIINKLNGDSNIYTSIVGSDNESSLSPEYATTSVTNDPIFPQIYSENPASYLPNPIEPIHINGYNDSFRNNNNNNNRQSLYYPNPCTLPSPQDSMNIWRINGFHRSDGERSYKPSNQSSFNDFSYLKNNHTNLQNSYESNSSSKYTELPCINSHF